MSAASHRARPHDAPHDEPPARALVGWADDRMRVKMQLEIPSDVRYIERIVDLVARQCADFEFPRRFCALNVPVALTEALSNAILRGNGEDAAKRVHVRASLDHDSVILEVQDEGAGFDIDAYVPDPTTPDQLEREDGRGLFLMRRLMDRVERIQNGPAGTIVRLTLHRP
jgi:serine/threonine-protein kinase RsbW